MDVYFDKTSAQASADLLCRYSRSNLGNFKSQEAYLCQCKFFAVINYSGRQNCNISKTINFINKNLCISCISKFHDLRDHLAIHEHGIITMTFPCHMWVNEQNAMHCNFFSLYHKKRSKSHIEFFFILFIFFVIIYIEMKASLRGSQCSEVRRGAMGLPIHTSLTRYSV